MFWNGGRLYLDVVCVCTVCMNVCEGRDGRRAEDVVELGMVTGGGPTSSCWCFWCNTTVVARCGVWCIVCTSFSGVGRCVRDAGGWGRRWQVRLHGSVTLLTRNSNFFGGIVLARFSKRRVELRNRKLPNMIMSGSSVLLIFADMGE